MAAVLALQDRKMPVTVGLTVPDEALGLDLVMGEPRALTGEVALSNSLAFGGLNAVLAFRRWG